MLDPKTDIIRPALWKCGVLCLDSFFSELNFRQPHFLEMPNGTLTNFLWKGHINPTKTLGVSGRQIWKLQLANGDIHDIQNFDTKKKRKKTRSFQNLARGVTTSVTPLALKDRFAFSKFPWEASISFSSLSLRSPEIYSNFMIIYSEFFYSKIVNQP